MFVAQLSLYSFVKCSHGTKMLTELKFTAEFSQFIKEITLSCFKTEKKNYLNLIKNYKKAECYFAFHFNFA